MAYKKDDLEKLSEHVFILNGFTRIGILCVEEDLYIIDTGNSSADGERIIETCGECFPGKKIKVILNTHGHSDHCGGNHYIQEKTGCEIWIPHDESKIMECPVLSPVSCWGAYPFEELLNPVFVTEAPTKSSLYLNDAKIELGPLSLTCIPLPGHYLDQTGILVKDNSDGKTIFFLGDGFFGTGMLKKFWIPFMYEPEYFRKSIEKIEATEADFYITSHGEWCTEKTVHEVAEMNMLVTLETEALIKKSLREKELTQEELLKVVADYAGINLKMNQYILIGSTLRSYLSSMMNRGIVTFQIVENRMLWKLNLQPF